MTKSSIWTPVDLSAPQAREDAIRFAHEVMDQADRLHPRHDLEWVLGEPRGRNPRLMAYQADPGKGVRGLALLWRRSRPLRFQLGNITYYRRPLTRYDLWSGPLITGVSQNSAPWRDLAQAFLTTVKAQMAPAFEVIGVESLTIGSPFHQMLYGDPATGEDYLLVEQGAPVMHPFIDMPISFNGYLEQLGERPRQQLAHSQRQLLLDFAEDIDIMRYETEEDVNAFHDHVVTISRKARQGCLPGHRLCDQPMLRKKLRFAATKGWLCSYIMFCSGRPAAFMLGHRYRDCFYRSDVGFDPDYSQRSVGQVLQLEVLEDLLSQEHSPSVFDLSAGYNDDNMRFGNREQARINVLLLPRTLKHAVLAGAYKRLDGLANIAVNTADRMGVKQALKCTFRKIAMSSGDTSSP